jgi:glutamate N-acetyltransferase/amino-acid N-acetyltransferase
VPLAADPLLAPLPADRPAVAYAARIPGGFTAAGTTAGIKASGRRDFALVVAIDRAVPAAAVFTPNRFAAAPVRLSLANLQATGGTAAACGYARAIVATSGSANAATGPGGDADQAAIGEAVAAALDCDATQVLHLSTGVIGVRLPLERVTAEVARVAGTGGAGGEVGGELAPTDEALANAAISLCTTDSAAKMATVTVDAPAADGRGTVEVTVTGICKGVGMIHPRMATMLSIVLTDASASPATLHQLLRHAAATTWDQLSVDGDTSTNDTVFLLASGTAGAASADDDAGARVALATALEAVARDLARQQARDGEGASSLITCQVSGAADDVDARAVARAVISSALVKAAIHGRDANWGRIAGAAGNATVAEAAILEAAGMPAAEAATRASRPAAVDADRMRIAVAGHLAYDGPAGGPAGIDKGAARVAMDTDDVLIRIDLGLGTGTGEAFGCPLTEGYVTENSEYTT